MSQNFIVFQQGETYRDHLIVPVQLGDGSGYGFGALDAYDDAAFILPTPQQLISATTPEDAVANGKAWLDGLLSERELDKQLTAAKMA